MDGPGTPSLDAYLARALLRLGRLPLPALQAALAEAGRTEGETLARILVRRRLLDAALGPDETDVARAVRLLRTPARGELRDDLRRHPEPVARALLGVALCEGWSGDRDGDAGASLLREALAGGDPAARRVARAYGPAGDAGTSPTTALIERRADADRWFAQRPPTSGRP